MIYPKIRHLALCLALAGCGEVTGAGADADEGNPAQSPTISAISPERGALGGGTTVTITGTGFVAGTQAIIGVYAGDVTVDSDTQLTVTAPQGLVPEELVDVTVFNGNGLAVLDDAFTFNPLPTASRVRPNFANIAGGATVQISGTGFMVNNPGTPTVTIGGVAATNVTVVDDETITADVPASTAAMVALAQDVVIGTANGDVTLPGGFAYTRPGLLYANTGRQIGPTSDRGIWYLDPGTARSFKVFDSELGFKRLWLHPNGTLYSPTSSLSGQTLLFTSDVFTGTSTLVGQFNVGGSARRIRGGTFVGNTLYIRQSGGVLSQVNLADGSLTEIGTGVSTTASCMVPGAAGTLVWFNRSTELLHTVATANGAVTDGPAISGAPDANEWRCHGGTMFMGTMYMILWRNPSATLYSLNINTGVLTHIADLPTYAAGLSQTPAGF